MTDQRVKATFTHIHPFCRGFEVTVNPSLIIINILQPHSRHGTNALIARDLPSPLCQAAPTCSLSPLLHNSVLLTWPHIGPTVTLRNVQTQMSTHQSQTICHHTPLLPYLREPQQARPFQAWAQALWSPAHGPISATPRTFHCKHTLAEGEGEVSLQGSK